MHGGGGGEPLGSTTQSRSMLGGPGFPPLLENICADGGHVGTRQGSGWCHWLLGMGRPSRTTSRSVGASTSVTGIYLVASVQQHPCRGQDVHSVEVEGAGWRMVRSLGNLLPMGKRKGEDFTMQHGVSYMGLGTELGFCWGPMQGAVSLAHRSEAWKCLSPGESFCEEQESDIHSCSGKSPRSQRPQHPLLSSPQTSFFVHAPLALPSLR